VRALSRSTARLSEFAERLGANRRVWATGFVLFILAALAFRLARLAAGYWEIDDVGITDSAAFELADHHSLAPYLEGAPVESYSNPFLFFLITLLRWLGRFDPVATHLTLEMLAFALMVVLVWAALREWIGEVGAAIAVVVFTALQLVVPATWIWYGSGLENVWVALGLVLMVWLCLRTARGIPFVPAWGNAVFLVAITRPEAPVYVAGFYAVLLLVARPDGRRWREHAAIVGRGAAITAALYTAFLVWRYVAYRSLFPNTYYAKLAGQSDPAANIRDYVVGALLPYCRAALFAGSAALLLMVRRFEKLAHCLLAFDLVALALPVAAGADFMGEHRFGTPFITIGHLTYASVVGVFVARLVVHRRRARLAHVTTLVAVLLPGVLLGFDHLAIVDDVPLSRVTVPRIAELNGGARWEHQMRLGLPYAVVMTPDVGGALLVGSMQLVDNGYLADFQTARLGRDPTSPVDRVLVDQYEFEERLPDLVDDNPYFPVDKQVLDARYVSGDGRFLARRDLVELAAVPEGARLLYADDTLRVYLTPTTVRTAAPGALMRCELAIAWTGIALDDTTRITVDLEREHDEIGLRPYVASATGIERRALLIGVPQRTGTYSVDLHVVRPGQTVQPATAFAIDVTRDEQSLARAATAVTAHASPDEAARRIAWLREQAVPRMGMRRFYLTQHAIEAQEVAHGSKAGRYVLKLRWNARLADLQRRSTAIRTAEVAAVHRVVEACPPDSDLARRALCLGRAIDELRRLGYLDVSELVPEAVRDLGAARAALATMPGAERYQALVGLVLADPSDLVLQRALLAARAEVVSAHQPWPVVSR
jgi:hypothetical protein